MLSTLVAIALANNNIEVLDIVLAEEELEQPRQEDALAHVVYENDKEPLPHGAHSRWFAMERQGVKDLQRARSRTDLEEPFYEGL